MKKFLRFLPLLSGFLLNGCGSTSQIYNGIVSQTESELYNLGNQTAQTASLTFGEVLYNFTQNTKAIAPIVIAGSMGLGLLFLLIVRKERTWRKSIFGFFIIGIPLLMFIISYGLAILVTVYQF